MEKQKPDIGNSELSRPDAEVFFNPAENGYDPEPEFVVRKEIPGKTEKELASEELLGITDDMLGHVTEGVSVQQKLGPVTVTTEFAQFVHDKRETIEESLELILDHPALKKEAAPLYLLMERLRSETNQ